MFSEGLSLNGPPDLDGIIRKFFRKGKNFDSDEGVSVKNDPDNSNLPGSLPINKLALAFLSFASLLWFLAGLYVVQPAEKAVLLRFGKFVSVVNSGLHWHAPFISSIVKEDVEKLNTVKLSKLMLTSEENIVHVAFSVQYRIKDLEDFFFKTNDPSKILQQSLESAVRQVVGENKLEKIMTTSRTQITQNVHSELERLLNKYETGILISEVIMQPAKAPEEVKNSFDDVIKAREDRERLQNEAESYANKIVPLAKGKAQRIMDEATAYEQKVVLEAEGNISDFDNLLPIYKKNPKVVRNQMYYQTMENIFDKNKVYVIEGSGSKNLFYSENKAFPIPVTSVGSKDD